MMRNGCASKKTFWIMVLCAGITFVAASCGITTGTRAFLGDKLGVTVLIDPAANGSSPIPFDLVVVYEVSTLEYLLSLSSEEWFKKKKQIKRDHEFGDGLDVWEWEWVPGQRVREIGLPLKVRAKGAVVYAGYGTKGVHRYRIDPARDIIVRLGKDDFSLELE